jgi:homoserine O-succinyltransferase
MLRRRATFIFFQGHPEYDTGALFREYRRDVGRFLAGTVDRYPDMPRGYFDDAITHAFVAFRARALHQRTRELLDEFPIPTARELEGHSWRAAAVRLYANWLANIVVPRHADTTLGTSATTPACAT